MPEMGSRSRMARIFYGFGFWVSGQLLSLVAGNLVGDRTDEAGQLRERNGRDGTGNKAEPERTRLNNGDDFREHVFLGCGFFAGEFLRRLHETADFYRRANISSRLKPTEPD